jgi:RNA polymerase sigma-70 factor (ECF subfamily)
MLPPRQRAVLILRDVLGWSSSEVAALLDATTASVNSALQRARATVEQQHTEGHLGTVPTASGDEIEQSLVRRYIEAWEAVDLDRLVGLLRSDTVLTMQPFQLRYEGRRAIAEFFATIPSPGAVTRRRLMPTRANRQPAVAAYRLDPGGMKYGAYCLVVLRVKAEAITEITGFVDPTLFPVFGLPTELVSYRTTQGRKLMCAGPDGTRAISYTSYVSVATGTPVRSFSCILHIARSPSSTHSPGKPRSIGTILRTCRLRGS